MDSDYEWPISRTHERPGTRKKKEIGIPTRARINDYVRDAINLLEVKGYNEIVLTAMGRAVRKALKVSESVKTIISGLHERTDTDNTCPVPNITITLSKKGMNDTEKDSDYESLSNRSHGRAGTRKEIEIGIPIEACISDFVRYVIGLLEEKGYDEIVLKATGRAVQNASEIAKSVKRSIEGLYESRYMDPVSIAIILSKTGSNVTKLDYYEWQSKNNRTRRAGTRKENEIGIPSRACISDYVIEVVDLLEETGYNEIVLKAMGRAVKKALKIAELVKRSISGLHESADIDPACPFSNITITLSKKGLNASSTSRGDQCSGSGNIIKVKKEGSMFCAKSNASLKEIEEVEDCFILEFNPFEPIDPSEELSQSDYHTASEELDLSAIAERGQVMDRENEKKEGSLFCLKNNASMKEIEEVEDCFILEFNPFETIDPSEKLSQNNHLTASDERDLSVIAERGQVACRDYPHSRHHCVKFPFDKTSHESYCERCYCYICDVIAPCNFWIQPERGHCHATEEGLFWRIVRTEKDFAALKC
ncbi:uncharacterized protein LOC122079708 isoform X2 [Macadamia integrifolia]|uniref:uncharacterized protein LOC122079708 isoform X2 n=1 Tax=Macadamia integrifolia TaxID=60698 RepID=UPI001C4E7EA7|nr:uncharacterized protein LOC122079708 isoform X2 [Macadamia integrifolia]